MRVETFCRSSTASNSKASVSGADAPAAAGSAKEPVKVRGFAPAVSAMGVADEASFQRSVGGAAGVSESWMDTLTVAGEGSLRIGTAGEATTSETRSGPAASISSVAPAAIAEPRLPAASRAENVTVAVPLATSAPIMNVPV